MRTKKLLSVLLVVIMVIGLVPSTVFAADGIASASDVTLDFTTMNSTTLIGYEWDSATKTLSLKGIDLESSASPAIKVPAGTTIVLTDGSVNTIKTSSARAIEALGSLTIKTADENETKGTLNIETGANGRGIIYRPETALETAEDVAINISDVELKITGAQRGIEATLDVAVPEGEKPDLTVTLDNVVLNDSSTDRTIQAYGSKGDATLNIKNSTVKTTGMIYVYSKLETVMNITGSTLEAQRIKLGWWVNRMDLAQLNVTDSTLVMTNINGADAAIEVGVNGPTTSEAHLKNSRITAVNDAAAAISVSEWMSSEDRVHDDGTNMTDAEWTQKARGTLTIDNCDITFAGVKYYGDLESATITNSSITSVVGTALTEENGTVAVTGVTSIVSDGETYTPAEGSTVTIDLDGDTTLPAAPVDLTISTVEDLKAFAAAVKAGDNFAGKNIVLANDIEVNDYWFNNESGVDFRITKDFAGTFDGKGFAIKGLKFQNTDITKNPTMYLFSSISGTVKNLTLDGVDADINDRDCFGFIAYTLTGTATNCHVKNVTVDVAVNASGTGYMSTSGAMFGKITSATVTDCSASNVKFIPTGTDNSDNVGALIGIASGTETARSTIKDCFVTDFTLDATRKTKRTGGFVGNASYTDVSNCTATNITFDIDNYGQTLGGFVGNASTSTFTDCKVDTFKLTIAEDAKYPTDAGGFCSYASNTTFIRCTVTGLDMDLVCNDATNGWVAGGFMGYASGTVTAEDCAVTGDINVTGASPANIEVGSFIGTNNNKKVNTEDITINVTTNVEGGLPFNGEHSTCVAEINGNLFTTLAHAVNAAAAGDTITLQADAEFTKETTFTMAEGVTLDLGGKTLTAKKLTVTGSNVAIKNGTIKASGSGNYVLYIGDGTNATTATVDGVTINNGGIYVMNKATATLGGDNYVDASSKNYAVIVEDKGSVDITGGTYVGGKIGHDVMCWKNNIDVTGGTFKRIYVQNYVVDGYTVVKNDNDTYTVKEIIPVATVNGNKYETLQAAINDAMAGDTVILLDDITEQVVINKSLTLDLGDFTITGNTDEAVLRIYSDVVDAAIDVTINATNGGVVNEGSGYAIYAGADLEDNDGNVADAERTNLTINGGTYKTAGTDCIKQIMGLCTINDGSYESSFGRTVINGERWYGSEFAINGGKFYGFNPACVSVWTGFDGQDQEGSFYHQHDIIAEGKTAEYDDGWYTVVDGAYTAKVSTKSLCYPSVEAAINASVNMNDAANLGVITLLEDDTLTTTVTMLEGTTLDLNGKTLSIAYGAFIEGNNITITNGTVKCVAEAKEYALFIGEGSATVTNVVVDGGVYVDGATVTLENVNATAEGKRHAVVALNGANVTINSGEYVATTNTSSKVANADATSNIAIYGGKFSKEPAAKYMADGKFAVYEDGWYVVSANQAVAEVNGKKYESLQDAINAAPTYYTVTLLANIEATEQIVINKSITLDLDEFTITGNSEDAIVRIYSAEVDKKIDVTIDATTGGIVNNGTGYAIYAGEDLTGGNDAERANLTIKGGTYETAGTDCIKQIMGLCTIDGGSYKSSYGRTVLNGQRYYFSEFTINGGSFYGFNPACVSVWTGGNDGTLYHHHDIIATGKTATYADGWYTVVDGTYTAKVETKSLCYPSLAAALYASINLDDVANLGVITLLADDTMDLDGATIELPAGLVIDLNGNTLTVPFQQTLFAGENITIKNGTITTGSTENYGLYIMSGSFTLENLTLTNGLNVQAGTVTLEDCDVTCPNKYYAVYAGANADVTILSGSYNTVRNAKNLYADGKITVYGGTFNKMPEAKHLAEDRHVVKSGFVYTVYEGFKAALAAAEDGDTVYLMSDIEVAETISIEKSITLDLGESTITSTAAKNVIYSTADLAIDATTGGIYSETAYVAVGQDNGVCTINGGSFKASGDTGDYANGQPVYNTLVLNNSDFYEGVTGSFVINGGKFYGFNPACMSVNKHDHHDHNNMGAGLIATLDAEGWFTVTEGEFKYMVVCDCSAPASAHQHCFATVAEAQQYIEMMGNCKFDKIVDMNGNAVEEESTDTDNEFDGFGGLF